MSALGIYVHWPFCRSKCPYCDFNSHVRERVDEARWLAALLAELDHYRALTGPRDVATVFFGGGTPSLMVPASAGAIIARIARNWTLAQDAEVTLEANPNSAERARFAEFRAAGINRLSLGVQALNDRDLAALGRGHDAAEAKLAIAHAAAIFERFSFDLIYARPGQTLADWRAELGAALAFGSRHLSLYQLTIEPGTAFHAIHARGDLVLPPEAEAADLFELTREMLAHAGLPAYEVSNHAAPGEECRHNLVYWRYQDYVGVGPGAHGRFAPAHSPGAHSPLAKLATRQARAPETWLAKVEAAGHATEESVALTPAERAAEALMMGLRLAEGIDAGTFLQATGVALAQALDQVRLAELVEEGFLIVEGARLRASEAGMRVLNALIARLGTSD